MSYFTETEVPEWRCDDAIQSYQKDFPQYVLKQILDAIKKDLKKMANSSTDQHRKSRAQWILDNWQKWVGLVKKFDKLAKVNNQFQILQTQQHIQATQKAVEELPSTPTKKKVGNSGTITSEVLGVQLPKRSFEYSRNEKEQGQMRKVRRTEEIAEEMQVNVQEEQQEDEEERDPVDNTLLKWEFDSSMPNWLIKFAQSHFSLVSSANQSEAMTKALYWRIVDASNPAVISEFSSEEFEELNAIFASTFKRGGSKENLEPSAERCLQILDKLDWEQLKFIGSLVKVKGIQGAVQEVRKLSKGFENKKHDQGLFDDEVDEVPALLGDLLEEDCLEDDVGYIFQLLCYACEWIKKSIPQRHNSERDVDMFVKSHIFSCLDGITDQHFGKMVSRASRDRRANALDSPDNTEGYHIDWMFTRHDLSNEAWGQEFSMCERAGSKPDNKSKILLDTLRVQKTMRDMHRALTGNIFAAGNGAVSKPVLNAFTKLLMPGFVSSYFFIRTILVVYVGAGFYASIQLSEFNIPTTYDQLGNIVNIAREMLRVKKILRSTISSFKAMKARADREKFEPGRIKLINSPPEFGTPSRKRISRKVSFVNPNGIETELAGFDLRYPGKYAITLEPNTRTCIDLKIALEIPATTMVQLASRSSLAKKGISIRGEIINAIAQAIFLPLVKIAQLVPVETREELGIAAREKNGFGSMGRIDIPVNMAKEKIINKEKIISTNQSVFIPPYDQHMLVIKRKVRNQSQIFEAEPTICESRKIGITNFYILAKNYKHIKIPIYNTTGDTIEIPSRIIIKYLNTEVENQSPNTISDFPQLCKYVNITSQIIYR
ncbi:hypothetical protein G9A89_016363 [Geosiphon pyriformis]|nr:hypothetical protein G9A89_016363 [Geosiphon pyriformis]